jgi:hypothetical protein
MSYNENYGLTPNINIQQQNFDYNYIVVSTESLDVRQLYMTFYPSPFTGSFTTDIIINFYVNNQMVSLFQAFTQLITQFTGPIIMPLTTPFVLTAEDTLRIETRLTNCAPPPNLASYIEFQYIQLDGYAIPIIYSIEYDKTQPVPSAYFNICGENFTGAGNVNIGGTDISFSVLNDSDISAYSPFNYGMVKVINSYGEDNSVDISTGSQGYGPNVYYWSPYQPPFIFGDVTLPSIVVGQTKGYIQLDPSGPITIFDYNIPTLININNKNFVPLSGGIGYQSNSRDINFDTDPALLTTDSSFVEVTFRDTSGVDRILGTQNGIYKDFIYNGNPETPYRYDGYLQILSQPSTIDFNPKKAVNTVNINISTSQIGLNQVLTDVKVNNAILPDLEYAILDLSNINAVVTTTLPEVSIAVCNTDTIHTTCNQFDICFGNLSVIPQITNFTADPSFIPFGNSTTLLYDMTMNFQSADICGTALVTLPSGDFIVTPSVKGNTQYEITATNITGSISAYTDVFAYTEPVIISFTPTTGIENITISLCGEFINITNAKIGVKDVSFNVIDFYNMEVTSTDISGYISATNNLGTGVSSTEFILIPLDPIIIDFRVVPDKIPYNYIGNFDVFYDISNISQSFIDGSANIDGYFLPTLTSGSMNNIPLSTYAYFTLTATNKYNNVSQIVDIEVIPGYNSYDRKVCFQKCNIIDKKTIKNNYDSHSTEISRISGLLEHSSYIRNKNLEYANKDLNVYKRWNGAPGGSGSSIRNSFI